jgi:adenylate kinase
VGKGTQAKLLAEEFRIPHYSTGDMLRAAVTAQTDVGRKAKVHIDAGQLVPDDVMIGIVRNALSTPEARDGFILDGFPRTVQQAEALTAMFRDLGVEEYTVVNIGLSEDEIVRRLSSRVMCPNDGSIYNRGNEALGPHLLCPACGTPLIQRIDDRPGTVRERLRVYQSATAPVLEYYARLGAVVTVDGFAPVEAVNRMIKTKVATHRKKV